MLTKSVKLGASWNPVLLLKYIDLLCIIAVSVRKFGCSIAVFISYTLILNLLLGRKYLSRIYLKPWVKAEISKPLPFTCSLDTASEPRNTAWRIWWKMMYGIYTGSESLNTISFGTPAFSNSCIFWPCSAAEIVFLNSIWKKLKYLLIGTHITL